MLWAVQDIVKCIIEQEAGYILAVKQNQKQLYESIQEEFRFGKDIAEHIHQDLEHGRIETRKCSVIDSFKFIVNQGKWVGLESMIRIESIRNFKNSNKPSETAIRYYITS